jgi:hypothetical protein
VALNLEPVGMMELRIHVERRNSYQNVDSAKIVSLQAVAGSLTFLATLHESVMQSRQRVLNSEPHTES